MKRRAECQINCTYNKDNKSWGAIAYSSKDKGFGWSHEWNDENEAKKVALDNCSKHGSGCEVRVWYYNNCAALAADGDIVTWGVDIVGSKAEQKALEKCKQAGGKNCVIEVTRKCSK